MKRRVVAGVLAVVALFVVAALLQGAFDRTEAVITPKVVVMRCLAMPEPTFRYQVATLSHTPDLELTITASTESDQGDDCAVAISQILALQGITANNMKMNATENALIVTVVK